MKLLWASVRVLTVCLVSVGCGTDDSKRMLPVDASVSGSQDAADAMLGDVTDALDSVCRIAEANDGGVGIVNGGFESPVVSSGGFALFATGASFPGWEVVGQPGNVAPVSGTFVESGITFAARTCGQALDLTGISSTQTGVSQTVATVPGTRYTLTFWIGNVANGNASTYGTTSSVKVLVDDEVIVSAVNSDGVGATSLVWKQFSASFVAASGSTKIAFINQDPPGDNSNFLDDVILR